MGHCLGKYADGQAGAADVLPWMRPCGFIGLEFAAVARKLGTRSFCLRLVRA